MRLTRKQKLKLNPTVSALRRGLMAYKRRMDLQMWHIDHLDQSIEILKGLTEGLQRIKASNSLRNVDKMVHAQGEVIMANKAFSYMTPSDPRPRGSESLVYDPHLIDTRGHKDLQARQDLDEPHQKPDVTY